MVYTNLINSIYRQGVTTHKEGTSIDIKTFKLSLLEQYKVGSILEGIVSKIESGYVLELSSGIRIPVSILDEIEIGKLIKFAVAGQLEDKLQLTLVETNNQDFIHKAIKDLKLPQTEDMGKCVAQFMDKNLPLSRESINQTYYLHKHYKIPTEVIINMLAKSSPLSQHEVKALEYLKSYGIENLMEQVKGALLGEKDPVRQLEILDLLITQVEDTSKQPDYRVREMSTKDLPQYIDKVPESLKDAEGVVDSTKIKHVLDFTTALTGQKDLAKIDIKELIEKLYDTINHVDPKTNTQHTKQNILEKGKLLYDLIEKLDKPTIEAFISQDHEQIKESLQVLHKTNKDGEYFIFPFMHHEQVNKGEVYFFKPSKKHTKSEKGIYVVVALDMTNLKHIEMHINKIEQKIALHIVTESQDIQKYIASHIEKLAGALQQMNYQVEKCSYSIKEEQDLSIPNHYKEHKISAFDKQV